MFHGEPRAQIEELLGHRFPESERGSVATLYDLSEEQLDEVRRVAALGTMYVTALLGFLLSEGHAAEDVWTFKKQVIDGGADLATWHRGPLFCGIGFTMDLLYRSEEEILAPLVGLVGLRWLRPRCRPTARETDSVRQLGYERATPGVLMNEGVDYYWKSPGGVLVMRDVRGIEFEPIEDLGIAMRRWLAARVALHLRRTGTTLDSLDVDERRLGRDGRLALRGLAKEIAEAPHGDPGLGFRGPDEWYRS